MINELNKMLAEYKLMSSHDPKKPDFKLLNLLHRIANAEQNLIVDWHKNTPENQPESERDIWYAGSHKKVDLLLDCSFSLATASFVTHWAYAELPELPEQDNE